MSDSLAAPEFDLRAHLRVLWRRKLMIIAVLVVLVGSAVVSSMLQTPVYEAEVKLLLQPRSNNSLLSSGNEGSDPTRMIKNEIAIIKSPPIRTAVRDELGAHRKVSVTEDGDTDVVSIRGRSVARRRASTVAQAYAQAYVDYRRTQNSNDVSSASRTLQVKIDDLQAQIDGLDKQITDEQNRQLGRGGTAVGAEPIAGLSAQRAQLIGQQGALKQNLDQLQLESTISAGDVQMVTGASVPVAKVAPRPIRTAIVAFVLALGLGVALALLTEYLDDSVKGNEHLKRLLPDVPILGLIPVIPPRRAATDPSVAAVANPNTPAVEAFRSLRTSLQFVSLQRSPRVFEVTSCGAADGKTSVVGNLGVVLARAGRRVLLIDCDLRRAHLHHVFDVPASPGFTSVFLAQISAASAIRRVGAVENLSLLPAGPLPPNPSEVLSSQRTAQIIDALRGEYDIVLIDSAPVLPVTDSIVLSAAVDATLLVVVEGRTTTKQLHRAVDLLRQAGAPLVGTVLNQVRAESVYEYYRYSSRDARMAPTGASQLDRVVSLPESRNGRSEGTGASALSERPAEPKAGPSATH